MTYSTHLFLIALAACRTDGTGPHTRSGATTDSSTVAPGTDTRLSELRLGTIDVEPAFESERAFYAVAAEGLEVSVEVIATTLDPNATVSVSLETLAGSPLAKGRTLVVAENQRIRVEVTSQDGLQSRTYAIGLLPEAFGRAYTEGTATPGFTFLASLAPEDEVDRYIQIVDDVGTPVWWRRGGGIDFRVTGDGRFSWHGTTPEDLPQPRNVVLSPEGTTFDVSLGPGDVPEGWASVQVDEHEWAVLDDGTALRILNGKVLEDLTEWGGDASAPVEHQRAQHIDLEGNVLFEVSSEGMLPYDVLPPNLKAGIAKPDFEPFHINSIDVDPNDGHWVLSMHRVSTVVKVARHGPQAGEVLWKLGGPLSDFTMVDDVRPTGWVGFAGQHSVRVVGPDRIAMFDNGLGDSEHAGDVRFVEYQLDHDAMEARIVDVHEWTGRGNAWAGGSVQVMPGDGHLIGFGSMRTGGDVDVVPVATELDAAGNETWNLWMEGGQWSYRSWRVYGDPLAFRYGPDPD